MAPRQDRMSASSEWTSYAPLDAGVGVRLHAAGADVAEGFARHRAWRYLAAEHVKNSYRRTVLGPWWLTAQTAVYVVGLGFVFSKINGQPIKTFLPYVAVGFLSFALLSGLTRACANVFVGQASVIKSTRQPLTSLVLRAVAIEAIQFGHNVLIVLTFFALRLIDVSPWLGLAPVAVLLMLLNGLALGLWLGPVVARFRDVSPAVDSVLQVIVFFTPIFYSTSIFKGSERLIVAWNPYTYFVDLFRQCVLGHGPTLLTVVGAAAFTLVNLLVAVVVFSRTRSRLPYWVA
jgi:lipopolysaccharide transport system permease protein